MRLSLLGSQCRCPCPSLIVLASVTALSWLLASSGHTPPAPSQFLKALLCRALSCLGRFSHPWPDKYSLASPACRRRPPVIRSLQPGSCCVSSSCAVTQESTSAHSSWECLHFPTSLPLLTLSHLLKGPLWTSVHIHLCLGNPKALGWYFFLRNLPWCIWWTCLPPLGPSDTLLPSGLGKSMHLFSNQPGSVSQIPAQFRSVQLLSRVWLFATPWTAAHQASLSIINSQSLLKLTCIESVMPSNHLILCRPFLLPPSVFPSFRVFSNESVLHIRWPKCWNFSFSISPSNECWGLISFRMDWLDLLAVQGTLKSLRQHHSSKASILRRSAVFTVQLSHPYMTIGKTIALTRWTFVGKVMSLLFNMLSSLVIAFLPRSKRLLISWLQSPSAVIFEPRKSKDSSANTENKYTWTFWPIQHLPLPHVHLSQSSVVSASCLVPFYFSYYISPSCSYFLVILM